MILLKSCWNGHPQFRRPDTLGPSYNHTLLQQQPLLEYAPTSCCHLRTDFEVRHPSSFGMKQHAVEHKLYPPNQLKGDFHVRFFDKDPVPSGGKFSESLLISKLGEEKRHARLWFALFRGKELNPRSGQPSRSYSFHIRLPRFIRWSPLSRVSRCILPTHLDRKTLPAYTIHA